jgi:hypothetical protein
MWPVVSTDEIMAALRSAPSSTSRAISMPVGLR